MAGFSSHKVGEANTPERQQALVVQTQARRKFQAIRDRTDLSPVGKQQNIAAVHVKTRQKLADLQQSEQDRIAAERNSAEATLFGLPATAVSGYTAISQRDAADRAATLTKPTQAAALLDRAQRSNDQHLASAVAQHAAENGWNSIVSQYAASSPAKQSALSTLADLSEFSGPADRMTSDMIFRGGTPPEVQGMSPSSLQALADQAGGSTP